MFVTQAADAGMGEIVGMQLRKGDSWNSEKK